MLHLKDIAKVSAGVLSIGDAGTFGAIVLSGFSCSYPLANSPSRSTRGLTASHRLSEGRGIVVLPAGQSNPAGCLHCHVVDHALGRFLAAANHDQLLNCRERIDDNGA
jgi:hypothetical protein